MVDQQHQPNGVLEKASSNVNAVPINKDLQCLPMEQQSDTQGCSGGFQNLYQSTAVTVCSAAEATAVTNDNTSESMPATTIDNGPNPIAMTTTEKSATFTITSSFESSNRNKVTFSVPVLKQGIPTTTNSVNAIMSQFCTKPSNVLDQSGMTDSSFDGTFSSNNTSFNQSTAASGFSSENALIVTEGTISCQLASSLTNNNVQPLDNSITENTGDSVTGSSALKKYICEHEGCTKTYRYKKDVIRHMKMKHGTQPTRYEQKEVPEVLLRKHGCSQCEKMYAHRKDLLRHQRDVHSPEAIAKREASKNNQKKYPCEQPNCNKFYVHKKDLIRHRRNDHNDFTDTKDMHIPEPVSPSQYSPSPAKRQRTNWPSGKIISTKAETVAEPVTASDVQQWLGVTVVKEGNMNAAAVMATSDSNNTGTLNCALFNTSPSSASNAASSLLSLLNSTTGQQSLPVDTAAAQLMSQSTAAVHPLFSAVTNNSQGTPPVVSNPQS